VTTVEQASAIEDEDLRVRAPVEPDLPIESEVMHARQDPADPDQAVLVNAPFHVDWLNFGDIVHVGEEDDAGVRPITDVVTASGHVRVMAITGGHSARALGDHLYARFPVYALRTERAGDGMLAASLHPDLDPSEVVEVMGAWLDDQGASPEHEDIALSPVLETRLGPVTWPD